MGGYLSAYKKELEDCENELEEIYDKYNKLNIKYENECIKTATYDMTIIKLEEEISSIKVEVDQQININKVLENKTHIMKNELESKLIESENTIFDLNNELKKYLNLNKTLNLQENKLKQCEDLNKKLNNEIIDLTQNNEDLAKMNNEMMSINQELHIDIDKISKDLLVANNGIDDINKVNQLIKRKLIEIIKYYYENKDIEITNILNDNNTMLPDYIETRIISGLYTYLLDKFTNKINLEILR